MTEAEWLASSDPAAMLRFLTKGRHGELGGPMPIATERKLRLFACACCRLVWDRLVDDAPCGRCGGEGRQRLVAYTTGSFRQWIPCEECGGKWERGRVNRRLVRGTGRVNRSRRAVEVAERYADGEATEEELREAASGAVRAANGAGAYWDLVWLPCFAAAPRLDSTHHWVAPGAGKPPPAAQAALLREVFGNPFRPRVVLPRDLLQVLNRGAKNYRQDDVILASVLAWDGGTVPRIAEAVYRERRWHEMPVLADVLVDAGCEDEALLDHLRGPGPHVRGCWALDLLAGRA